MRGGGGGGGGGGLEKVNLFYKDSKSKKKNFFVGAGVGCGWAGWHSEFYYYESKLKMIFFFLGGGGRGLE